MMRRISRFFREFNLLSKALNILALIATTVWLTQSVETAPSIKVEWEPVAAFIVFLASLTWLEVEGTKKTVEEREEDADKMLFAEFLNDLPSDGSVIRFLRLEFTGISYNYNFIVEAESFADKWDVAEKRFHDEEIEQSRDRLVSLIYELLEYGSHRMSPNTGQFFRIHCEPFDPKFAETEERLTYYVSEIINTHQELIRRAKIKLHI